jgi:hypothetical protein
MVVFGSQTDPNWPQFSHTFATFIKEAAKGGSLADEPPDTHTISWLPTSLPIAVLRPVPEPGINLVKNLILIRPGARIESGVIGDFVPLSREDAEAIRKKAATLLIGVAPEQMTQRLVSSRTANWLTGVAGVVPDLSARAQLAGSLRPVP